jgi:predicted Zn-dependent peptidase
LLLACAIDKVRGVKHCRLPLTCLALLLSLPIADPQAVASVKLPHSLIHQLALANGLHALLVENHDSPVVTVEVWYHVGSKDEEPGKTGFAHLFEHLMYQGTKNLGPEEYSDYIIRYGGLDNAYTTEDMTVFWETMPSSVLPVALWLEADRMRNLQITDKAFKNEREVVKEERRERFDNQPYGTVVETLYQYAYTIHPYRHMTIGSMEDLDRATVADVQAFYDRYYVPNNAVLVIVGDIDTTEAESLVRQDFAKLSNGPESVARASIGIPPEPPQTQKRVIKLEKDVALPAFVEGYHMPADGTPDAYPLRIAAKILSQGESSRIYRRLVYEKQMAVQAETEGNFTEDPNLFFVMVVLNPGYTHSQGEAEVAAELDLLKTERVSQEELDKAKNQVLRDFVVSRQSDQSRAEELGYAAVVLKNPNLLDDELDRFQAVTPDDIQRVAKKYFVPENVTTIEVTPKVGAGK